MSPSLFSVSASNRRSSPSLYVIDLVLGTNSARDMACLTYLIGPSLASVNSHTTCDINNHVFVG